MQPDSKEAPMTFSLQLALPSDAEALIRSCDFPAMLSSPLRRLMFPHSTDAPSCEDEEEEEEIRWNIEGLRTSLESPGMRFWKVCRGDGRPVGFAGWTLPMSPGKGDDEKKEEDVQGGGRKGPELPEGLDIAAWLAASRKFRTEKERVLRDRKDIWRLNLISVDPAYQRKGVGSALMEWGCGQADETGADMFVMASPAGRRLYEKFGFEAVGGVEIGETVFTSMVRKARVMDDKCSWNV